MTVNAWIHEIARDPSDSLTWDAFADWLEEQGDEVGAWAFRAPGVRDRRPKHSLSSDLHETKKSYDWCWSLYHDHRLEIISFDVFCALGPPPSALPHWVGKLQHEDWREYSTETEAFVYLFRAILAVCRDTGEVPGLCREDVTSTQEQEQIQP